MKKPEKRPAIIMVLFDLLILLGLGGFAGGAALMLGPDGHIMGFPPDLLKVTPFSSYFIPGLVLFTFVGIYPFFVAFSLLNLPDWRLPAQLNPFKKMHWVWTASLIAGAIVAIWIIVQVMLLGYTSALQPVYFFYGLVLIMVTLFPNVRQYLSLY